jgi:hypothetical protein
VSSPEVQALFRHADALTSPASPLLGSPHPSESCLRCSSALLAWALPLRPSGFPLRPLGFSLHRRPRKLSPAVHPPWGFGPPTEYDGTRPLSASRWTAPLMRFRCLMAPSASQVRSPRRVPPRRRLPSSGFCNLSTVCSLRCLAGLFRPASTSRLSPSGFHFPGEPYRLSTTDALLPLPPLPLPFPGDETPARLQGLAPPETSAAHRHAVKRGGARNPLGVPPLQGFPSSGRGPRFRAPPLPGFGGLRSRRRQLAPQGISEPEAWLISRETASPPEVLDLVDALTRSKATPDRAYRFTLGATSRHRDTAMPSLVRARSLPEPDENIVSVHLFLTASFMPPNEWRLEQGPCQASSRARPPNCLKCHRLTNDRFPTDVACVNSPVQNRWKEPEHRDVTRP